MMRTSCTLLYLLGWTLTDASPFYSSWYKPTWDPWKPTWMSRGDLLCDRYCKDEYGTAVEELYDKKAYDKCCDCRSSTTWQRDNLPEDLYIEYTTADGENEALPLGVWNNSAMYRIIHQDGVMTSLPSNICKIPNLMYIDFSGNKIRSLSGIECATKLDTVILKNNQIDLLSKSSIANLTLLRVLDISHNLLKRVEPNTISNPDLTMLWVDLSDNNMTALDVTNAASQHMFCLVDLSRNQISKFTNELDFKLDVTKTYGPGMVDLEDNQFTVYPNFKKLLKLDTLSQLGKLFEFGFDFRGAPLMCDCNMETFLNLQKDILETIWRNYHNVTCAGPKRHAGKPVNSVPLHDLVCTLGVEDDCPIECTCVDQPYHNMIWIDCVNALMTSLPAKLPVSEFAGKLALNMTGNNIEEIPEDLSYIDRIDVIDLTGNDLVHISDEVASRMENTSQFIIVDNPRLKSLPQQFLYRDVCSLNLGEQVFDCDCNSRWIEQWMNARGCHSKHNDTTLNTDSTTLPPSTNDIVFNTSTNNSIVSTTDASLTTNANSNNNSSSMSSTNTNTFITTTTLDTTTSIQPTTTTTTASFNNTHNNIINGNDNNGGSDDDRAMFYCRVPSGGVMKATDFKSDELSCEPDIQAWIIIVTYALGSVLSTLILVAIFVYVFRYEILILFIRGVLQKPKENVLTPHITYDAFVSFDEENPDLIKWTEKLLIPDLEKDGYKLFIPYRHLEYGDVRDDATIEAMNKSRNTLLLMSESYLEPTEERPHTENEWKYGWNKFKSNRHTPIIVVNFDHITSDMVDDPRIKAYLRVGKVIDFTNQTRDIVPIVEVALGKSFSARERDQHNAILDTRNARKGVQADDNVAAISFTNLPERFDIAAHEHFQPTVLYSRQAYDNRSINDHDDNESLSEDIPPIWNRNTTVPDKFQQASVGEIKLCVEAPVEPRQAETIVKTQPSVAKQQRVKDTDNVQQRSDKNENTTKHKTPGSKVWSSASKPTDPEIPHEHPYRNTDQNRRLRFSSHLLQSSKDDNPVMYSKMFRRAYPTETETFV